MNPEEKNDSWKNGGLLAEKERRLERERAKKKSVITAV